MASDESFGLTGVFRLVPPPTLYAKRGGAVHAELAVISTDPASAPAEFDGPSGLTPAEMAWEHVSVSVRDLERTPTWEEMAWVKRLFWEPVELVYEFHPPEAVYVNNTEALHLWRPLDQPTMVLPPPTLIGLPAPCRLGRYTPRDAARQLADARQLASAEANDA